MTIASHLVVLTLFAALVALVFALLMRETPKERLRFGLTTFALFLAAAILIGWLMYPFPS